MVNHRIYTLPVASVYSWYITKAEKKGRIKDELAKSRPMEKVLRKGSA